MRIVLSCLLGCAIAFPAAADVRPPASFYDRANQLMDWIVDNTDYRPAKKHPIYVFLADEELNYIFFETTAAGYSGEEQSEAVALYLNGIVFLSEDFRLGEDDDVLLHELVHHLQAEQGRSFPCVRAGEKEAYELQAKFIRETGIGGLPDPMWAHLASRCEDF